MAGIGMKKGENVCSFIQREVNPDDEFLRETGKVIGVIVAALQTQSEEIGIKEIIKGGSLGKGTAIKGKSDIDLLVMLKNYDVDDLHRAIEYEGILTKIRKMFEKAVEDGGAKCNFTKKTHYSVQFQLRTNKYGEDWHDVDILPIADLDLTDGRSKIYREMKRKSSYDRAFYSGSLCKLQIDFVKHKSSQLKDVIRFCKYWKKINQIDDIPSYGIELIAIKVCEEQQYKSTEKLVSAVFEKLMHFRSLALSWNDNYDNSLCERMNTPYIRDPANPFMNVLQYTKNINRIETAAGQMRATIG